MTEFHKRVVTSVRSCLTYLLYGGNLPSCDLVPWYALKSSIRCSSILQLLFLSPLNLDFEREEAQCSWLIHYSSDVKQTLLCQKWISVTSFLNSLSCRNLSCLLNTEPVVVLMKYKSISEATVWDIATQIQSIIIKEQNIQERLVTEAYSGVQEAFISPVKGGENLRSQSLLEQMSLTLEIWCTFLQSKKYADFVVFFSLMTGAY